MFDREPQEKEEVLPLESITKTEAALCRHLSAAEGYLHLRMFEEARKELDLAEKQAPLSLEVAVKKLDLFLLTENWKQALIYGEILTEFDEEEPEHFLKYAAALHATGKTTHAIHILALAPDEIELDPECQLRLATYELGRGHRDDALFHLENAIALSPDFRIRAQQDDELGGLLAEIPAAPHFVPSHLCPEFIANEWEDGAGPVDGCQDPGGSDSYCSDSGDHGDDPF